MTQTDQELDRIERSIEIDASAEKVWSLLEQPGWWINEHEIEPDTPAATRATVSLSSSTRSGESSGSSRWRATRRAT